MSYRTRKGNGSGAADAQPTDDLRHLACATAVAAPRPAVAPAAPPFRLTRRPPAKPGFSMAAMQGPDPYHAIRVDIARNGGRRVDTLEPMTTQDKSAPRPFTYGRGTIRPDDTTEPAARTDGQAGTIHARTAIAEPGDERADKHRETTTMPQISKDTKATIFALQFPDATAYIGRTTIPDSRVQQARGFWPECEDPVGLILAGSSLVSPDIMEAWRIAARKAGLRVRSSPKDAIYPKADILYQDKPNTPQLGERATKLAETLAWPTIGDDAKRIPLVPKPGRGRRPEPAQKAEAQPIATDEEARLPTAEGTSDAAHKAGAEGEVVEASATARHDDTPMAADAPREADVGEGVEAGRAENEATQDGVAAETAGEGEREATSIGGTHPTEPVAPAPETASANADHEEVLAAPIVGSHTPAGTNDTTHRTTEPQADETEAHEPTAEASQSAELVAPTPFDATAHARRILDDATLGLGHDSRSLVEGAMNRLARLRYGDLVGPLPVGEIVLDEAQADAVMDEIEGTQLGQAMLVAMTRSRTLEEMADRLTARANFLNEAATDRNQGRRSAISRIPAAIATLAKRIAGRR